MQKLIVFLSSAQHGDELYTEREGLKLAFIKPPLFNLFELWRFEEGAAPEKTDDHYRRNIRNSQAVILILGTTLRDAVIKEYTEAQKYKIPVFAYIKKNVQQSTNLRNFIENCVFKNETATGFFDLESLVKKVENDLIRWLIEPKLEKEKNEDLLLRKKLLSADLSRDEKALRLLSSIVFSENSATTQEEILRNLVIAALLKSVNNRADRDGIIQDIASTITLTEQLQNTLNDTINIMITEGILQIVNVTSNTILLNRNTSAKKGLTDQLKRESESMSEFYNSLKISKDFSIDEFKHIMDVLVAEILTRNALLFAREIFESSVISEPYNKEQLEILITTTILSVKPKGGVSFWFPIIHNLFTVNNRITQTYLVNRFKAYFILLMLNLDPDCTRYEATYLKQHTVFVDSHVLLRTMVNAGGQVDICRKIIAENRKRGIKTYITKSMFEEINNSFKYANDVFLQRKDIKKVAEFFKEMNISSDVFDGYLKVLKNKPSLTWSSYINIFWSPTRREVLESYLQNEVEVEIFPIEENIRKKISEGVERITKLLLEFRKKMKKYDDLSTQEAIRSYERQLRLRKNEAMVMALIYLLRSQAAKSGKSTNIYFVTFDQFVYQANSAIAKTDSTFTHPCYYKPARWLDMISIFADKAVKESTFRQLLCSEDVKRIASLIEAEVLNQMLKNRVDEEISNIETLKNLFNEIVNRPAIQEAYEEMRKLKGVESLQKALETEKLIGDGLKSEMTKLKKVLELEKKEKQKECKKARYFRKQVGRLTSERDKKRRKKRRKKKDRPK